MIYDIKFYHVMAALPRSLALLTFHLQEELTD